MRDQNIVDKNLSKKSSSLTKKQEFDNSNKKNFYKTIAFFPSKNALEQLQQQQQQQQQQK